MYYIKVNTIGKIEEAMISSSSEVLVTDDYTLIEVTEEMFNEIRTSLHYWDSQFIKVPIAPDVYHEFDYVFREWRPMDDYLSRARVQNKEAINSLSSDIIIKRYPIYRQINYNRAPAAQSTIDMNSWIDEIRGSSNIANTSIDLVTDLTTMENIVNAFQTEVANL